MLGLEVEADDLLKWARLMRNMPKRTKTAIARGLNTVGDNIVREAVRYNAEMTGLDPNELESLIVVKKATPDDPTWSMDQSAILTKTDFSRPWDTPDDNTFDQGTLVKVVHSGDDYVCEKCIEVADQSPYTLAEVRAMNPYGADFGSGTNLVHPNAVLEGSRFVSYGHLSEMVRAVFSSNAIRAETTVRGLTIGPNHPILTRRGFVPAQELEKGDELLCDRRCEWTVGSDLDFEKMPFVENAFASLFAKGEHAYSRLASADDLHGDAMFCEREVDIVRTTRGLLFVLDPRGIEKFSEFGFPLADVELLDKAGRRSFRALFETALASFDGIVGGSDLILSLAGGHARPFDRLLFRGRSSDDTRFIEDAVDDRSARVKELGQRQHALARFVEASDVFRWDRVLDVHWTRFHGLAFDATTGSSLYNSDGYVVHNCRCITQAWQATRTLPVSVVGTDAPPELFTMRELGEAVAAEMKVAIFAKD